MWELFKEFEGMLRIITNQWVGNSGVRLEREEIFNELVLQYARCYEKYHKEGKERLKKILWMSCRYRMLDIIKQDKDRNVMVVVDNVETLVSYDGFREVYRKFFVQEMVSLLETSEGKEIVDIILNRTSIVEEAASRRLLVRAKKSPVQRKPKSLCKQDLEFYLREEGWRWNTIRRGFRDVEQVLQVMFV